MTKALCRLTLSFIALAACGPARTYSSTSSGQTSSTTAGSTSTSTSASSATGSGGSMGTGGSGSGGGDAGPSAAQACADVSMARCQKIDQCSNHYFTQLRYADLATCQSRLQANCESALAAPGSAGTPAGVEACATDLASEACADYFNDDLMKGCAIKAGSLADGSKCAFPGQCTSTFCLVPDGKACGNCGPVPKDGDPCVTNAQCGPNQACNTTGTCSTFADEGAPCGQGVVCGSGLSCVGATPTVMGVCQAAGATVGAACDGSRKTAPDCNRSVGLYCSAASKQCAAVSLVGDGQLCGTVGDAIVMCAAGGLCVIPPGLTEGTCKAAVADGQPCDTQNGPPCRLPASCIVTSGTAGTCKLDSASTCH